jgi:hypothetical protein
MSDEGVGSILDISSEGSCRWWLCACTKVFLMMVCVCVCLSKPINFFLLQFSFRVNRLLFWDSAYSKRKYGYYLTEMKHFQHK